MNIRDSIVHYKAVPSLIDKEDQKDSYVIIKNELKKVDIKDALTIVGDLEKFLETEIMIAFHNTEVIEKVIETLNKSKLG